MTTTWRRPPSSLRSLDQTAAVPSPLRMADPQELNTWTGPALSVPLPQLFVAVAVTWKHPKPPGKGMEPENVEPL